MLTVRKRGNGYYVDFQTTTGRLRGSLGTRNQDAARRLAHRLELAAAEGPNSDLWRDLREILPRPTFARFVAALGVNEKRAPTWKDLSESFSLHLKQKITIGKLSKATADRYAVTIREFQLYLTERNISLLQEITKPLVESFKVWRLQRIKERKQSRSGTGLVLDVAILHRVFAVAMESEMVNKNPVRMEGRPGNDPHNGAQPFCASELLKLREHTGQDLLALLVLRWTGFRGSDAVSLTWNEVHFDRREIERITQKRKKKVILPIQSELLFVLEAEHARRNPELSDRVLINPTTNKPLTRPRLYQRMVALGRRAEVPNTHPHRFRDTLAVDMLARGASAYDVAKMLGDTIETVEKHYTPFVKELRERVRLILENDAGIEKPIQLTPQITPNDSIRPN